MHSVVTYEPWHDIRTYYLICENDNAIKLPMQEKMVAQSHGKIVEVRCTAGHSPFVSLPQVLLQLIQRAVEENQ